jgi:hypothetical protein
MSRTVFINAMTSSALGVNGTVTSGSSSTVVKLEGIRLILFCINRMRGGMEAWRGKGRGIDRKGNRERERERKRERENLTAVVHT